MKKLYLALLSGLCLSFAWFSWSTPALLFIALVPLFWAIYLITNNKEKLSYLKVWGLGFVCFLLWNVITSFWLKNATLQGMLSACLTNAFLMSLVMLISYFAIKRRGFNIGLTLFAALWICFEKMHFEWELSWPLLTLGNGFAFYPGFVQWYEYTGALGGSLWILCSNIVLFNLWVSYKENKLTKPLYKNFILPLLLIFAPIIASFIIEKTYKEEGVKVEVIAIQPNYDPYTEKFYQADEDTAEQLLSLADSLVTPKTWLIAAPETVLSEYKSIDSILTEAVFDTIKKFCTKNHNVSFIFGSSFVKHYGNVSELPSPTANISPDGRAYDVYNAAVFVNTYKENEIYLKSKLVPGVELFPYRKVLEPIVGSLVYNFGGMTGSNVTQKQRAVFSCHQDSLRVAPIICYEGLYGEFVGGYARKGANILCVITNDGWWGNSEGHKQLLAITRLRCIETRLPMLRAANTGISAFISPLGKIEKESNYGEKKVLRASLLVNPQVKLTIYTTYGDYIARCAAFVAFFMLLYSIFRVRSKK